MKTLGKLLPGVKIIEHKKYRDNRGDFCELWKIAEDNMRGTFRQLNCASSIRGVLRGMHRQDQTKLVMPIIGKIFDVALEPETGRWFGAELDEDSALLIPPQYAHGYVVLSNTAKVQYIVDSPYNKSLEENFSYNNYDIPWPIEYHNIILSEKDSK